MSAGARMNCGRAVCITLVAIHFVLPFTPVNPHDEARIIVASLVLGISFSGLGILSFRKPFLAFCVALAILLMVYLISALSGASPIQEGIPVKIVFVAGLGLAIHGARDRSRNPA